MRAALAAARRLVAWTLTMAGVLVLLSLGLGGVSHAAARTPPLDAVGLAELRAGEIAQCLPGELSLWPDGRDRAAIASPLRLQYQHAQAPAWLDEALVLAALSEAVAAWQPCGVPIQVLRGTAAAAAAAEAEGSAASPPVVPVVWDDAMAAGSFGLANLGQRRLALGPSAFGLLRRRPGAAPSAQSLRHTLHMVLSHELGHLLGLVAHSRRCIDVMSYYDNGQGERCRARDPRGPGAMPAGSDYRAPLPTACDLARCRALNTAPATPLALPAAGAGQAPALPR